MPLLPPSIYFNDFEISFGILIAVLSRAKEMAPFFWWSEISVGSSECFRRGVTVKLALPERYAVSDQSRLSSLPLLENLSLIHI